MEQDSVNLILKKLAKIEFDIVFKEQTDDDYWDPATNGQEFKTEKFPCEICGKSFSRMDKLKEHNKIVHEGIREHKCETCGKEFGRANQLQANLDLVNFD